jgi:2-keto-4-pentenoate hydratase
LQMLGTKCRMTSGILDDRIDRGMRGLKLKLAADLKSGARQVGWKLAFGSPIGLKNLQIDKPLVGYLLDRNEIASHARIKISTWTKPVGEAEIALYFGKDIPESANVEQVMECISALGPAIEIADLYIIPTDPEPILSGDIFQRHYILGERDEMRSGGDINGLTASITMPDGSISVIEDLEAMTGKIPAIVHHFAQVIEKFSGGVKAGEFLIIGSIVPPILVLPAESFTYSLGNYPTLEANFTD